jgi:hypothetical protein
LCSSYSLALGLLSLALQSLEIFPFAFSPHDTTLTLYIIYHSLHYFFSDLPRLFDAAYVPTEQVSLPRRFIATRVANARRTSSAHAHARSVSRRRAST